MHRDDTLPEGSGSFSAGTSPAASETPAGGWRNARVVAVCASPEHGFSKPAQRSVRLVAGLGVEGDAHAGTTVKHRSRVRRDPTQPNLRQVHLIHAELFEEVAAEGYQVEPGQLGENVTTSGVDLLGLPVGTVLRLGETAEVEVTGLRNPCYQIDDFESGLLKQMLDRAADGSVVRKAGVMAVVRRGGVVAPGDPVAVELPPPPHQPLSTV
jgi:MOSC domain-containing protein YiiM